MRMFLGLWRYTGNDPFGYGAAIDAVSRVPGMSPSTNWVMKDGPATHAYVVFEHLDGYKWRLDAQHPKAIWQPAFSKPGSAEAWWEVLADQAAIDRGFHRARMLTGTAYDWGEAAGQAAAALRALVPALPRPPKMRFPFLPKEVSRAIEIIESGVTSINPGRAEFFDKAKICTSLTIDVQSAIGSTAAAAVAALPNTLPETLGQSWRAAERSGWLKRVEQ